MKKIHKKDGCGIYFRTTTNDNEVTCKKCLRLINDEKAKKTYEVFFAGFDGSPDCKIIKAPTSSKAIYKCFKMFRFDAELIENIGIQFQWFRRCKPKAILLKDENIKPSLTYEEEQEQKKQEAINKAAEFNSKYPIGTKVLFQADFTDKVIVTTTRSEAQVYNDYLTIFLNGVSGSYLLDDRFVRVLTDENKDLERLRND
ncbi:hypothetical protein [Aliarcobacter butzleri]|uniref:hypothetical protein n=1 Tax=Aliarcobacter butzleri TaxID=28197 RepID=UPI00158764BE|nr:hypothetical protein [Aliarcobacter butzleri]NUW28956.1 hypothetical protein [Aliarcobacter butzleri]